MYDNRLISLYHKLSWKFLGQRLINLGGNGIINLIDVGSVGALPPPWYNNPGKVMQKARTFTIVSVSSFAIVPVSGNTLV